MNKPDNPDNHADRGPETRTDEKHGRIKNAQRKGSDLPDRDLARGSEPETRGVSGPR
jgi:hypothetical protein